MDQYLNILNMISEKRLPDSFDYDSKEIDIILNLIEEGLIFAKVEPVYGSTLVYSARLTIKGEEKLKESKLSAKTMTALHKISFGIWKYVLIIISGILIGFFVEKLKIIDMFWK